MKLLFLPTLFVLATSACLDGESEIGGLCYTFVDRNVSFEDARDHCHSNNAYLAYVQNLIASNFIASRARTAFGINSDDFWIGLNKDCTNCAFKWDNGAPVVFTNFGNNNGQNYVAESVTNGKWNTFLDGDKKNFVCSYDPMNPMTVGPTISTKPTTVSTTDAGCSPESPRTFLFAYSTDFDYSALNYILQGIVVYLNYQPIWTTYANIRFDMKNADEIEYHHDASMFNASVYSHLPDSSLGFMDSTTGSDVFNVIKNFLKTSPTLCGSYLSILVKRYPNEVEDLNTIIDELRKNHIFVYIIASDTPSGGNNPSALFTVSSRTNGLCDFCGDEDLYNDADLVSDWMAYYPFQVASKNVLVSGEGSQDLSFRVYNGSYGTQWVYILMTFLTHKNDGSVNAFNYTLKDSNGNIKDCSPRLIYSSTLCGGPLYVNNTMEYTLTVEYDYKTSRQEMIEMRVYSHEYEIDHWLPFDN